MAEFIGILKVKVLNGTDLAVRDMLTSDPYVVLTLGKQVSIILEQKLVSCFGDKSSFGSCFIRNDTFVTCKFCHLNCRGCRQL